MSVELTGLSLALTHFSLEVSAVLEAPVTAVFGPSGSGKTTLLEVIAGLRRPHRGSVRVGGEVLTDAADRRCVLPEHRRIGYVTQEGALFPHLSVGDNLRYGARSRGGRPAGLTFEHVADVLEIGALTDRYPATLSGGEKQRVALGRALLAAPRLLLLDEPLAGLDQPLRDRLLPYLARVRDEFAIPMIYVTHSPDEVVALCYEVLVLEGGRVTRHGRVVDLFSPAQVPRYEYRPGPPTG